MLPDSCEHLEVGFCTECYYDLANRVRREERERCALICDKRQARYRDSQHWEAGACASAIRNQEDPCPTRLTPRQERVRAANIAAKIAQRAKMQAAGAVSNDMGLQYLTAAVFAAQIATDIRDGEAEPE